MDEARRIIGAEGYEPFLRTVTLHQIATFRRQVELVDWIGERDLETLRKRISSLAARSPGRFEDTWQDSAAPLTGTNLQANFTPIKPGGQREPLIYDPKGYPAARQNTKITGLQSSTVVIAQKQRERLNECWTNRS